MTSVDDAYKLLKTSACCLEAGKISANLGTMGVKEHLSWCVK